MRATTTTDYSPIIDESEEEDVVVLEGREAVWARTLLFWMACGLGVPFLLGRWYPVHKARLLSRPVPLSTATLIIFKEEGEAAVCPVLVEPSSAVPLELRYGGQPLCRYFLHQFQKWVWNEREGRFMRLSSLLPSQSLSAANLLEEFKGLSPHQRTPLQSLYGRNVMAVEVKSYWRLLVEEVLNPFYVFQILSLILWCLDDYVYYATCVVLISAISISVSLVETKRQAELLRDMASGSEHLLLHVRTHLQEEEEVLTSGELVPGDVLLIPPQGFVMPCDGILTSGSCIVNESMLTGESIPVHKSALPPSPDIFNPDLMKRHTIYAGTQVIQTRFYPGNKVSCLVFRTGFNTLKGQLIRSILYPKELDFKFYADAIKFVLILFCCATGGMIYSIFLYVQRETAWYVTLIRVLDIVTIVVPPALPAAMTIGTVYAQARLRGNGIFCISPPRINFCGKLKLMCFDKTGTLTEEGLDLWCVLPVGSTDQVQQFLVPLQDPRELQLDSPLLRAMASCHSLTYIHGNLVGDPLDLKMFASTGWDLEEPMMGEGDAHKFDLLTPSVVKKGDLEVGIIREFEFTPQLQRMSVVVRSMDSPNMTLYSKGAPEKIRHLCVSVPPDFDRTLDSFTRKGYRVLAMAWKPLKKLPWHQMQRVAREAVEKDLFFSGFLVMQNSLKSATIPVIAELLSASIRCVMVTGDNVLTALSVARECGLIPSWDKVIIVNASDEGKPEYVLVAPPYSSPPPHPPILNNNVQISPSPPQPRYTDLLRDLDDDVEECTGEGQTDRDRLLPFHRSLVHTILELQEADYHFVMDGRTWTLLFQTASTDELEQIISKGTVFARMSPENKSELVEALQGIGYVVGMCGDGANDCSALKMAHVGISLSEAEASVAAPFTSNTSDVSCVPTLVREGRCALVTSFSIFKYMALYSMVQFASVIILYTYKTNLADTQFLYIDLGITTTIAVVMGRTEAYPHLVSQRPMGSLVSFQNVFSILIQILISVTVQIGAMTYLTRQPWYVPLKPSSPDQLQSLCWETTTIFSVSSFQYLILALVFSKGPPFRRPVYSNGLLMVVYGVLGVVTVVLVVHPFSFLASFFYLEGIEAGTTNYRYSLLIFPVLNLALSFLFEDERTRRGVKRVGRALWRKKEKSRYKTILGNLRKDGAWPPLKHQAT